MSPLLYAIKKDNTDIVKLLLKRKADPKVFINETGESLVHIAAKNDNKKIMKQLMVYGVNLETKDNKGNTPFHVAAMNGGMKIISFLNDKHANIDSLNNEGQTPLHLAVINKQYDAAFELILSFAEIIHDIKNLTPIDYALQFPENERIRLMMTDFQEEKDIKKAIGNKEKFNNLLHTSQRKCGIFAYQLWNDVLIYGSKDDFDTLINEKVNINVENPIDKKTPLHQVCEFGNLYYAKTLIENGANINTQDNFGNTPLHSASYYCRSEIVKLLIDKGSELKTNLEGESPLEIVNSSPDIPEKQDTLSVLLSKIGFQMCLEKLNNQNDLISLLTKQQTLIELYGSILLFNAITNNQIDLVKFLLMHGVDPNAKDTTGFAPLHQASFDNRPRIVEILLKNNADINSTNNKLQTPLHLAAEHECLDALKVLVKYNPQLTKDINDETPVDVANKKNQSEAMKEIMKGLILLQSRDACLRCMTSKDLFKQQLSLSPEVAKFYTFSLIDKACEIDNPEILEVIFDEGIPVNVQEYKTNNIPLHIAIIHRAMNCFQYLLSKGSKTYVKGIKQRTPILAACAVGCPEMVETLLFQKADYAYDEDGKSPHDLALESGDDLSLEIADEWADKIAHKLLRKEDKFYDFIKHNQFLLQKPNAIDFLEYSLKKKKAQMFSFLLKNNISLNIRFPDGKTILHIAIKDERYEVVELLLKYGAYSGVADNKKRTPLYYATKGKSPQTVDLLIKYGATNKPNYKGKTPLDNAEENSKTAAKEIIESMTKFVTYYDDIMHTSNYYQFKELFKRYRSKYAIHSAIRSILFSSKLHLEYLINHGLSPNACDEKGYSLLHYAIPDHIDIVEYLLNNNADPNAKSEGNYTPLHMACKYKGTEQIVHLLIEHGANVNAKTINNITPLFFAVKISSFSVISALLNKNADPNIRSDTDIAPLDLAVHNGFNYIIDLLISKGADPISLDPKRINKMNLLSEGIKINQNEPKDDAINDNSKENNSENVEAPKEQPEATQNENKKGTEENENNTQENENGENINVTPAELPPEPPQINIEVPQNVANENDSKKKLTPEQKRELMKKKAQKMQKEKEFKAMQASRKQESPKKEKETKSKFSLFAKKKKEATKTKESKGKTPKKSQKPK